MLFAFAFSQSGRPIPDAGLDALRKYEYRSGGYSPLEMWVNPFWEWCVQLLPMVSLRGQSACSPPL